MSEHLRNIGGAVLGYVVMFAGVVALMSVFWMAVGADGAFRPASWEVSGTWSLGSIVVGLVAGIVGGLVCARVASDDRGVWMLIVLVVILGVATALTDAPAAGTAPGVRPSDVPMTEAMMSARQPAWLAWLNPVLGAVGAFLGARMVKRG